MVERPPAEQHVQKTAPQRAHQSRPRDVPPETLQGGARTLRPAGGVTIGQHRGVHRPGRSARDAVDVQPGLLEQPVQRAPGKGTMRAAALQRKVDENRIAIGFLSLGGSHRHCPFRA